MPTYNPADIERRWQQFWETRKTFRTPDPDAPEVKGKPKYYVLDMFPYPSGAGLHVGHPEGYTATDILARYKRMRGFHVLHPMGWDAFGLPAEQYAVEKNVHPRITTRQNIDTFRRQIKALGFSYDWDREVDTTDPAYFKWTQWIFLLIHDTWYDADAKKGRPISELPIPGEVVAEGVPAVRAYQDGFRLAFQAEQPVNWCPALGTVLANEEVIDGRSERGHHPVTRLPLRQWLLRITAYADRLIDDLEPLDWSESIKQMQRNWIGRSEGAEVQFPVARTHSVTKGPSVAVFTTRPDTLFGATYLVLAPEHALVEGVTTPEQKNAVEAYRQATVRKSDFDRTEMTKTKTGVFTGGFAVNPVNGERLPIWIADYVLGGYGTGAIMAVPGHDERDFEFARQFHLPIRTVIHPNADWMTRTGSTTVLLVAAYTGEGIAMNSEFLNGLPTAEAKAKITDWLEARLLGRKRVNFKLRDWLFSRQRYWGEPFPIRHNLDAAGKRDGTLQTLPERELPLLLPDLADFKPTGTPDGPLAKATDWVNVKIDDRKFQRETNTMPQWAGSCWYYLRYIDPQNGKAFADPKKLGYWLPVDLYVGGAEHAVLHLLYSRFWHKVLFDRGYVTCPEPFHKLVNQGMILGEAEYHIAPEMVAKHEEKLVELNLTAVPVARGETLVLRAIVGDTFTNLTDDAIEKRQGKAFVKGTEIEVVARAEKMSKARGNVVNPDDVIAEYGADSLRLYEMFMGPLEAVKPWSTRSVKGVSNFLGRVWRLVVDDANEALALNPLVQDVPPSRDVLRELHRTIQKVTDDTEGMRFNTAISAMMEFTNFLTKQEVRPKGALETFVKLLAPFAPHAAEEMWRALGHADTLAYEPWPAFDAGLTKDFTIEIPVQINGKLRAVLTVPAEIGDDALEAAALADPKVREALGGKDVKKVIVRPRKLVNLVV